MLLNNCFTTVTVFMRKILLKIIVHIIQIPIDFAIKLDTIKMAGLN